MLDDQNIIIQRDPSGALQAIQHLPEQATFTPDIHGDIAPRAFSRIVMAGMGGSALAADMVKVLVRDVLTVPLEVVKGYTLPAYVDDQTLVIAISHSGNTEETLSCYEQAKERGAALVAMATGGALQEYAERDNVPFALVPNGAQPRMSTVYHLRILLQILQQYTLIDSTLYDGIANSSDWLREHINHWSPEVPTEHNYAKQIAERASGKIGMFYGGELTAPIAYKWKISWNESSKNVAFWNQFPEFNHNEFIGWVSHPIEKPFAVFDLRSHLENPRITERMELTDQMLSGNRPHTKSIQLEGESLVQQFLWGLAFADMSSVYLAILNNVNPVPVELVEKFKQALS